MTRIVSSDDELHVGISLPRQTARNIFQWAKDQPWPEGSKLQEPKDFHITLLYSPVGHELKDSWWISHLDKAVVNIVGFDNFSATEQDGFAYVLLIDSPDILMKADELQSRAKEFGLPITDFPGGYKPHITVAYGPVKAAGIKAPYFEFDVGPSEVSPRRIASRVAYNPEEVQVLDQLSLANIAHNLHYKFEQDPNTDIVTYAKKLLNLVGYPQDDITAQAALQSWQQMYPKDKLLKQGMAADPYWLDDWTKRNGPYLWHKTRATDLDSFRQKGILPWDHPENPGGSIYKNDDPTLMPRPGHTYLQHQNFDRDPGPNWLRVDVTKLNPELMNPDEDRMIHHDPARIWNLPGEFGSNFGLPIFTPEIAWDESYGEYANDLNLNRPSQTAWGLERPEQSNPTAQTMAYNGTIPPHAIDTYSDRLTKNRDQEKFGHVHNELCYPLGSTHTEPKPIKVKQPDELEGWDEKSTVPSEVNNPEDQIPEFGKSPIDKQNVQVSNEWLWK